MKTKIQDTEDNVLIEYRNNIYKLFFNKDEGDNEDIWYSIEPDQNGNILSQIKSEYLKRFQNKIK